MQSFTLSTIPEPTCELYYNAPPSETGQIRKFCITEPNLPGFSDQLTHLRFILNCGKFKPCHHFTFKLPDNLQSFVFDVKCYCRVNMFIPQSLGYVEHISSNRSYWTGLSGHTHLQILKIRDFFDSIYNHFELPPNVTDLTLYQSGLDLPESVRILRLCQTFDIPELPACLKELHCENSWRHALPTLPQTLTVLKLSPRYRDPVNFPHGLIGIEVPNETATQYLLDFLTTNSLPNLETLTRVLPKSHVLPNDKLPKVTNLNVTCHELALFNLNLRCLQITIGILKSDINLTHYPKLRSCHVDILKVCGLVNIVLGPKLLHLKVESHSSKTAKIHIPTCPSLKSLALKSKHPVFEISELGPNLQILDISGNALLSDLEHVPDSLQVLRAVCERVRQPRSRFLPSSYVTPPNMQLLFVSKHRKTIVRSGRSLDTPWGEFTC